MKIAYVANIRLPTERAHGYQIMRVCSELARLGHTVTLYVPRRHNHISSDPFEYYGIENNFTIVHAASPDLIRFSYLLGSLAFVLAEYFFARSLDIPKEAIVYTRDHRTLFYLARCGYTCFYNAHNWERSRARFVRGARGIVCNSTGTEKAVREVTELPTVVAPNAADPNPYADTDKHTLREELKLPAPPVALYAGHLYAWKGVDTIYEAARLTPDVSFVFVGGTEKDVDAARKKTYGIPNATFLGHRPRKDVPKYLVAADILLLPATARSEESSRFTSPIKLFEYMASGTAVVASDVPSIREVLSEKTATLVSPDDPQALVEGIRVALQERGEKVRAALELSKRFTWGTHANIVSSFLNSNV